MFIILYLFYIYWGCRLMLRCFLKNFPIYTILQSFTWILLVYFWLKCAFSQFFFNFFFFFYIGFQCIFRILLVSLNLNFLIWIIYFSIGISNNILCFLIRLLIFTSINDLFKLLILQSIFCILLFNLLWLDLIFWFHNIIIFIC